MDKQKRKPPIQCRPKIENEWLYAAIKKRSKKLKHRSISFTIEQILIETLTKHASK